METPWSKHRKWIYGAGFLIVLVLLFMYFFRDTLFPSASCFDKKQNGYETGVDCGGLCSLRCAQDVIPLSVVWSQAVETSSSTYDLVAMVSNKNIDNAPRQVSYTFMMYDKNGTKMAEVKGVTIVPLDGDFPVIKQNIKLPESPTTISAVVSTNVPHYKVLENPTQPTLRVTNSRYEAGGVPRVYATITNTKRLAFRDMPIRVVLYDATGNVFAVGETIVPEFAKESSRDVVFTWNKAFTQAPTKISVFPILDPFLGSQ